MKTSRALLVLPLLLMWSLAAPAAGELDSLRATMQKLLPPGGEYEIKQTPVDGLYEVQFAGRIWYFTKDGNYVLRGDLIDVSTKRNLTEETRRTMRVASLERLGEASMIVYSPENPKYTVTVFTDIDCPYCAKFHREVPKLNELGIKVRYAAFPRRGLSGKNYDRMVSVWCAKDPLQAMTDAKEQKPLAPAVCDNPVKSHYGEGHALGVGGTPTIILDNGELVGGYVPYGQLLQMLEAG
ncbi:MAG: thiol:disulfide interchange protein DsbC [Gammaproteobacteria bacterium]|jgi:thiol:disulfide interchange protein DsbC